MDVLEPTSQAFSRDTEEPEEIGEPEETQAKED